MTGAETPEAWFHRMATDYVAAQIVFALNQAGVWRHLAEHGPCSVAALARALDLAPGALDCLLDYALQVQPLLERDAHGDYAVSEFGRAVLRRFERVDGERRAFNLFDVRIGAYGPVWRGLEALLRGARYGVDVVRDGRFAEDAVYKIGPRFLPALTAALRDAGRGTVVELGVNSGLLERLAVGFPGAQLVGVDRSASALLHAARGVEREAQQPARWIRADVFDADSWTRELPAGAGVAVFSLHFHEFLARGSDAMRQLIAALRGRLAGARILVLEQPRLPASARAEVGEVQWLYAQSNVLIHHLIGNGRILDLAAWQALFVDAGCRLVGATPTGYLGYQLLAFDL